MKLSKVAMMSAEEATTTLTAALKGFQLQISDLDRVNNILSSLDSSAAVTARGVSEALSLIANSARMAGFSIEEAAAMVSTIGEVTQQSMNTVGNAVKTVLARFGNVKAGVFSQMGLDDDGETTENINDIEKVLKVVGISIRSSSLEMRNMGDVLDELAEKWNTLDTVTRNSIASAMAGVRQREAFNTLMANYDRYKELTNEAENAEGTTDQKYAAQMESLAKAITDMQNAWEKFVLELKASPIIKTGVKTLTFLIDNMKTLLTIVTTLGARVAAIKAPTWLPKLGAFVGIGSQGGNVKERLKYAMSQRGLVSNKGQIQGAEYAFDVNQRIDAISGIQDEEGYRRQALRDLNSQKIFNPTEEQINKQIKRVKQYRQGIDKGVVTKLGEDVRDIDTTDVTLVKVAIEANTDVVQQILAVVRKQADMDQQAVVDQKRAISSGATPAGAAANVTGDTIRATKGKNGRTYYFHTNGKPAKKSEYLAQQGTSQTPVPSQAVSNVGDIQKRYDKNGNPYYMWPNGQRASKKDIAAYEQMRSQTPQGLTYKGKLRGWGGQAIAGVASGIAGGFMAGATKTEIVDGAALWTASGKKAKEAGISVEADTEDKVIQGVSTGVLTAGLSLIPGIGPILGATLGPLLGGWFGDLFTLMRHQDEIDRKLRVEEAQKQLEILETIQSSVTSLIDLNKTRFWGSQEYQQAVVNVDAIEEQLLNDTVLTDVFLKALKETGLGADNISQAMQLLLSEDWRIREQVLDVFQKVSAQRKAEEVVASNEEIYYSGTREERAQAHKKEVAAQTEAAFYASGMANALAEIQKTLGLAGATQVVLGQFKKMEVDIYDTSGVIKDEYVTAVQKAIKTSDNWNQTLKGETVMINDLVKAENQMQNILSTTVDGKVFSSVSMLKDEIERIQKEDPDVLEDFAKSFELTVEQLMGAVYSYDESAIFRMARALGITVEELKQIQDFIDGASVGDTTKSSKEHLEDINKYVDLYSEYISNGGLFSQDTLANIVSDMPDVAALLNKPEELLQHLSTQAFGMSANRMMMEQAMYDEYIKSTEVWAADLEKKIEDAQGNETTFKEMLNMALEGAKADLDSATIDAFKQALESGAINSYETARPMLEYLKNSTSEMVKVLNEQLAKNLNITLTYQLNTTQYDYYIEEVTCLIDKQLDNLNQQKEAISQINDQRKKELEYIKAQIALENASKEKKRVYRAGVGFTFMEDTEAEKGAQETLDDLDSQRQEEYLQLEIERLELQKEILDFIPDEAELQKVHDVFEAWTKEMGLDFGENGRVPTAITDFVNAVTKIGELYPNNPDSGTGGSVNVGDKNEQDNRTLTDEQEALLQGVGDKVTKSSTAWENVGKMREKKGVGFGAQEAEKSFNSENTELKSVIEKLMSTGMTESKAQEAIVSKLDEDQKSYVLNNWSDIKRGTNISQIDLTDINMGSNGSRVPYLFREANTIAAGALDDANASNKEILTPQQAKKQFVTRDRLFFRFYDPEEDKYSNLYNGHELDRWANEGENSKDDYIRKLGDYAVPKQYFNYNNFSELPPRTIIGEEVGDDWIAYVGDDKQIRILRAGGNKNAKGTLGLPSDQSTLINELGTEAIVTPQGTVTALPAKTGIVPADITKNLWALGKEAPNLVRQLSSLNIPGMSSNNSTTHNDGTFIDTLNMTVYPTKDYDMDRFIKEAKARARISNRNN